MAAGTFSFVIVNYDSLCGGILTKGSNKRMQNGEKLDLVYWVAKPNSLKVNKLNQFLVVFALHYKNYRIKNILAILIKQAETKIPTNKFD